MSGAAILRLAQPRHVSALVWGFGGGTNKGYATALLGGPYGAYAHSPYYTYGAMRSIECVTYTAPPTAGDGVAFAISGGVPNDDSTFRIITIGPYRFYRTSALYANAGSYALWSWLGAPDPFTAATVAVQIQ